MFGPSSPRDTATCKALAEAGIRLVGLPDPEGHSEDLRGIGDRSTRPTRTGKVQPEEVVGHVAGNPGGRC